MVSRKDIFELRNVWYLNSRFCLWFRTSSGYNNSTERNWIWRRKPGASEKRRPRLVYSLSMGMFLRLGTAGQVARVIRAAVSQLHEIFVSCNLCNNANVLLDFRKERRS